MRPGSVQEPEPEEGDQGGEGGAYERKACAMSAVAVGTLTMVCDGEPRGMRPGAKYAPVLGLEVVGSWSEA